MIVELTRGATDSPERALLKTVYKADLTEEAADMSAVCMSELKTE